MDKKAKAKARRQVRRGRVVRNAGSTPTEQIAKMQAGETARKRAITKVAGRNLSKKIAEADTEIRSGADLKKLTGKSNPMSKFQGRQAAKAIQAANAAGARLGLTDEHAYVGSRRTPRKVRGAKPAKQGTMFTAGSPIHIAEQMQVTNVPGRRNKRAVVLPGSLPGGVIPGARYRNRAGQTVAVTGSKTGKTYVRKAVSGPVGYLPIAALFAQHLLGGDKKKRG